MVTGSWSKNQPFKSGLMCWFQIFKVPKHFENGNCKSHSEKNKPPHLQPLVVSGTLPAGTLAGLIALPEIPDSRDSCLDVLISKGPLIRMTLELAVQGSQSMHKFISHQMKRHKTTEELAPNRVHTGQPRLFHTGCWCTARQVALGFNFSHWRCWPSRWLQRTGVPSKAYNGGHFGNSKTATFGWRWTHTF